MRPSRPRSTSEPPTATVGVLIQARCYREAIVLALGSSPDLIVVDVGDGAGAALERLLYLRPDVVLLDLPPDVALGIVRQLRRGAPQARLVALDQPGDGATAISLFEAGLMGLLLRDANLGDLRVAIAEVQRGEVHCPPRLAAALIRRLQEQVPGVGRLGTLTPRERQVLGLLDLGHSNKEIAALLGIEISTVKTHVHRVLGKTTGLRRRVGPTRGASRATGLTLLRGEHTVQGEG